VDIKEVDILKLQTNYMQQDDTTKAISAVLTPQFRALSLDVKQCLILGRVDDLIEEVLDELAEELHIEWYDSTASIDVKRSLVMNSDKVHMYLGTPYAVEQVIQDYFGDGEVEEWFEYGGRPFFFRVITSNPSVTSELANQFTKAVESVKRKSTRLEQIIIQLSGEMSIYLGAVIHTGDNYIVRQVV
jgi:P2-related tail formation protein